MHVIPRPEQHSSTHTAMDYLSQKHAAENAVLDQYAEHQCYRATRDDPCVYACGCHTFPIKIYENGGRHNVENNIHVVRKTGCNVQTHNAELLCEKDSIRAALTRAVREKFAADQKVEYDTLYTSEMKCFEAISAGVPRTERLPFCSPWEKNETELAMSALDALHNPFIESRGAQCGDLTSAAWKKIKLNNSYRVEHLAHNEWLAACLARYINVFHIPCTAIVDVKIDAGADPLVAQAATESMFSAALATHIDDREISGERAEQFVQNLKYPRLPHIDDWLVAETVKCLSSEVNHYGCDECTNGRLYTFCWMLCGTIDYKPSCCCGDGAFGDKSCNGDELAPCSRNGGYCACFSSILYKEWGKISQILIRRFQHAACERSAHERNMFIEFLAEYNMPPAPCVEENEKYCSNAARMANIQQEISELRNEPYRITQLMQEWSKLSVANESIKNTFDQQITAARETPDLKNATDMLYAFFKKHGVSYTLSYEDLIVQRIPTFITIREAAVTTAIERYYRPLQKLFHAGGIAGTDGIPLRTKSPARHLVFRMLDEYRATMWQMVCDREIAIHVDPLSRSKTHIIGKIEKYDKLQ